MPDYVYKTYNELLKSGWRMKDIDEMDILGFFRVRAWAARNEQKAMAPKQAFIDEVWGQMA